MKSYVFDLEGDGFIPTKIYVISYFDGEKIVSLTDYDDMRKFIKSADKLIGHNIIRFDIPVIERILGIKVEAELVDTLGLSWYLYPKRVKHGLADWGEEFGVPKPEIDNWENLPLEDYIYRCEEDVKINLNLWRQQFKHLKELYEGNSYKRLIKYLSFKLDCARAAEESKWKLDSEKAQKGLDDLNQQIGEKEPQLIAAMPKDPDYAVKDFPAKPYKKDGTLSVQGVKWFSLLRKQGLPEDHKESVKYVKEWKEPNPGSHVQLKKWLFELGWEPEHYKYVRDKETNEVRKIPQIKSEFDDSELCQSVLDLAEKEPAINNLAGLNMLKHRRDIFKNFLKNVENGYVQALISGFTNTLRFKHKAPLVNLPKPSVFYGEQIRGCLIAGENQVLCGSDMSSLEDRTKLHYMYFYDPDYVEEMSQPGFDPHLDLAMQAGVLTLRQVQAHKDGKEDHGIIRHIYKTANYACVYGSGAATVARGAKITVKEAEALIDVYWKRNWAVKEVVKNTKTKTWNKQSWLFNPVSRMWYSLRNDKDIFSTLNQGTGVYAFDTWIKYIRSKRPQLTGQFHDEIILTIKKGFEDKCEKLLRWAIDKTNEQLKLNRELDIDIKFGQTYAEIH